MAANEHPVACYTVAVAACDFKRLSALFDESQTEVSPQRHDAERSLDERLERKLTSCCWQSGSGVCCVRASVCFACSRPVCVFFYSPISLLFGGVLWRK